MYACLYVCMSVNYHFPCFLNCTVLLTLLSLRYPCLQYVGVILVVLFSACSSSSSACNAITLYSTHKCTPLSAHLPDKPRSATPIPFLRILRRSLHFSKLLITSLIKPHQVFVGRPPSNSISLHHLTQLCMHDFAVGAQSSLS